MARAMGIASELISISLEMALIPLGGYWLDRKFEMAPLFLLLGCLLGFSIGFYHLVRFASSMKHNKKD
jgi:F0F1-type ATP synthase assembly protein I